MKARDLGGGVGGPRDGRGERPPDDGDHDERGREGETAARSHGQAVPLGTLTVSAALTLASVAVTVYVPAGARSSPA